MPKIPLEKNQFWFRSTLFEIEDGEDEETNPLCYGRQLANWLAASLRDEGVRVEDVFPEDWGWCVMVKKAPFSLWVGCSNVHGSEGQWPNDTPPRGKDVVWTCTVVAEVPLWKRFFRQPDTAPEVAEFLVRVKRLLVAAPGTALVDEP